MMKWLRDIRTFLRWRKGTTFVLFVYPTSSLHQARIKDGRIELGEGGLMYGFRAMIGDSLNGYVAKGSVDLTEED